MNFLNILFKLVLSARIVLVLFLTEEAYAKWLKPRRSPSEGVRPSPFMLAWVTNVSTSPDLYIEFSTEY